jgi:hypothetical protein
LDALSKVISTLLSPSGEEGGGEHYCDAEEHPAADGAARNGRVGLGASFTGRKMSAKLLSLLVKSAPPQKVAQFPPAPGSPPQQMEQARQYVQPEWLQFESQNERTSQLLQAAAGEGNRSQTPTRMIAAPTTFFMSSSFSLSTVTPVPSDYRPGPSQACIVVYAIGMRSVDA